MRRPGSNLVRFVWLCPIGFAKRARDSRDLNKEQVPQTPRGVQTHSGPFVFFSGPLLFFGWAGGSITGNCHTDRSGRACTDRGCSRKTQNCRRFWPPLLSSRLSSVYSHKDRGSWSQNSELSSLLASLLVSRVVLASQKGSAGVFAIVFAFSLAFFVVALQNLGFRALGF